MLQKVEAVKAEEKDSDNQEMESVEKQDDFLLCEKCLRMSEQLNSKETSWMSDILLNCKTIDDLLPFVCDGWSTARRLIELPPYDFRTFGTSEFSFFEHVMLYKFWYKVLEQSYRKKLHEELYRDLLDKN